MQKKRLLTIEEAAQYIGHSPQTIRNRLFEKNLGIPFCRVGRKILFDLKDLDKWVDGLKRFGGA
jgi:excisionase family DNA binding protein